MATDDPPKVAKSSPIFWKSSKNWWNNLNALTSPPSLAGSQWLTQLTAHSAQHQPHQQALQILSLLSALHLPGEEMRALCGKWTRWTSFLHHCETFSSWIMDVFHHNRLGDQKKRTSMIIHDHKWSPEFDPLESTSPSDHIQRLVIILKLEYPVIFMIATNWITRIQSFLRSTAPPPDSVQGFGSEAPELVGTVGCMIILKLWWLLHGYRLEI